MRQEKRDERILTAAERYTLEQRCLKERASTLHIQIYSYEDRVAKGAMMSMLDKTVIPFIGLDQLCLFAEEYLIHKAVFDGIDTGRRWISKNTACETWQEYLGHSEMIVKNREPYKFAVRFLAQGNQSLQGELRVDNRKCYFRSGMELMRLMHQWLQIKYKRRTRRNE